MKPANRASQSIDPPATDSPAEKPSLGTLIGRALRLRCAVCGQASMFRNWMHMQPNCPYCGFHFERGPGYWLGSIYVNYGLTALIVTMSYFGLFFMEALRPKQILIALTAFCVLFPLWFFRYARAIWQAADLYFDPPRADEFAPNNGTSSKE